MRPGRSHLAASAPALCALSLAFAAGADLRAVETADDDTAIPPLQPDALAPWWPSLERQLPTGFASTSVDAIGQEGGASVGGSAWAGGMRHPSPGWTWGAALGYHQEHVDYGDEFPREWHGARAVVGAWRRFSLDDHLILVAAPGLSWGDRGGGEDLTVPLAALWIHRSGRSTVWGVGAIGVIGYGRPIALPVAGVFFTEGPWNLTITPLFLSADRLLSADASLGVFAGVSGDSVPVRSGGRRLDAAYWDLRAGVRAHWKASSHLSTSLDAGWAAIRHVTLTERIIGGDTVLDRRLDPAPFASLGMTWTW